MSVMMSDMKTASKKAAKKARVRSQKPLRREFTVRDMNRSGAELLEAARKLVFAYRRHMVQKRVRLRKLQRELGIEEWRRNHVIVQCSSTQLDALEGVGRSFSAV